MNTVAAFVCLMLLSTVAVQKTTSMDDARQAAEAMVQRFVDSWNRADAAAYGENYWPEAELVDPSGRINEGRTAIVQQHVDLWAGIFKGTHQECRVRRAKVLSPNYVVVDFDCALSGVRQPPPGGTIGKDGILRAHLKHIMEKRQGSWKVLLAQNTIVSRP